MGQINRHSRMPACRNLCLPAEGLYSESVVCTLPCTFEASEEQEWTIPCTVKMMLHARATISQDYHPSARVSTLKI